MGRESVACFPELLNPRYELNSFLNSKCGKKGTNSVTTLSCGLAFVPWKFITNG